MSTLNESMQDFVDFMHKYSDPDSFFTLTEEQLAEAHQATQDSIIDELITEIDTAKLIQPVDKTFDVELDYDNLREWLRNYYVLEKK